MKKPALILLLVTVVSSSWTQNYHTLVDTNKIWSIAHSWGQPFVHTSDYIKFLGDTTFNGYQYKQVWKTTDTLLENWTSYGYIREDNKQVYYLSWTGGTPNNLIYDFGADAGDTVYLFSDPMGIYYVVDSVDSYTFLTGEIRKRINLSSYSASGSLNCNDTWIEGMGSLYGILQSGLCGMVGDNPQLLCFHENDTLKYFNNNFDHCYIVTAIDAQETVTGRIRLFPNPSKGVIFLHVNDPLILPLTVTLFDPLGKQIYEKQVTEPEFKFNLNGLTSSSLIFYQLTGPTGFAGSGKILVQGK
jgi:hypothetical protein